MISVSSTFLEKMPGELFLTKYLQTPIKFTLGKKIIKQGKLILYKRSHYYLQITLLSSKNNKESFEIPIPFKVEEYLHEGLAYFDYRVESLGGVNRDLNGRLNDVKVKNINPSYYFNKILEIQAEIL